MMHRMPGVRVRVAPAVLLSMATLTLAVSKAIANTADTRR